MRALNFLARLLMPPFLFWLPPRCMVEFLIVRIVELVLPPVLLLLAARELVGAL